MLIPVRFQTLLLRVSRSRPTHAPDALFRPELLTDPDKRDYIFRHDLPRMLGSEGERKAMATGVGAALENFLSTVTGRRRWVSNNLSPGAGIP